MTQEPFETSEEVRHDRREHGGMPLRPDDDELARRTEEERVAAGIADYVPEEVPPATDDPVPTDLTETDEYQEEQAEIRRQTDNNELHPLTEDDPFPPTRYDRS